MLLKNNHLYQMESGPRRQHWKHFSFAISFYWYHVSLYNKASLCMYFNTCPMPTNCRATAAQVQHLGVENKQRKHFFGNGITAKLRVTSKLKPGRWQIRASRLQRYGFTSSEMHNNEQCKPATINNCKMNTKYLMLKQKKHPCAQLWQYRLTAL